MLIDGIWETPGATLDAIGRLLAQEAGKRLPVAVAEVAFSAVGSTLGLEESQDVRYVAWRG